MQIEKSDFFDTSPVRLFTVVGVFTVGLLVYGIAISVVDIFLIPAFIFVAYLTIAFSFSLTKNILIPPLLILNYNLIVTYLQSGINSPDIVFTISHSLVQGFVISFLLLFVHIFTKDNDKFENWTFYTAPVVVAILFTVFTYVMVI